MTIEPGLFRPPPLRNRSPSGNGVTGGAFCCALALEYPKFATLTRVGEKICVSCVLRVYRLVCRSEEHTSELQSRFDLVCRLLLEKKKFVQRLAKLRVLVRIDCVETG